MTTEHTSAHINVWSLMTYQQRTDGSGGATVRVYETEEQADAAAWDFVNEVWDGWFEDGAAPEKPEAWQDALVLLRERSNYSIGDECEISSHLVRVELKVSVHPVASRRL